MRIAVLYRVKNEENFLADSIKSVQDMADNIYVFDDHSTDNTVAIAKSFSKVKVIHSTFSKNTDEARDKEWLVEVAMEDKPDWCFGIDADERLIKGGAESYRAICQQLHTDMTFEPYDLVEDKWRQYLVYFRFLYVWNENLDIRTDGVYKSFLQPRLWNVPANFSDFSFKQTEAKRGFHCGWVPQVLLGGARVRVRRPILHFGNHTPELRRRKYVWYNIMDPSNWREDRYRHIIGGGENFAYAAEKVQLEPLSSFWKTNATD